MNSKKRFRGFEVSSESPLLKGRKHIKHATCFQDKFKGTNYFMKPRLKVLS